MNLWIIIPFIVFELLHLAFTLFLLMAVGGLGKQHQRLVGAIKFIALQSDGNFENIKNSLNDLITFINKTFDLTTQDQVENEPMKKVDPKNFLN